MTSDYDNSSTAIPSTTVEWGELAQEDGGAWADVNDVGVLKEARAISKQARGGSMRGGVSLNMD
jgi:hypothetical protein